MHYVCSPFGSSGDVHPMLGLALALKERGHRVTMICSGYFEDLIRSHDLEFCELGTKEEFLRLAEREELWKPFEAFQFLYREGVAQGMRQHYELLDAYRHEGPLVTISNVFGFGARVAQEKLGIPLVMLHLQPSVIWSEIDPPKLAGLVGPRWLKCLAYNAAERWVIDRAVCPSFNAWRAELGLAPVRRITRWWQSPWCVACLFPAWFAPPQSDWPANLLQTSFPLWDAGAESPMPADLAQFLAAGEPPIVFTPGSANRFGQSFFAAAVEACRRLGRRGLLLTKFDEQVPTPLPAGLRHVAYAPFRRLLPHCAALVHHGGVGSMAQAMAAGIPQLIVALAHDQFDNGQRVQRLGAGEMMPHRGVSGRRMAASLGRLLAAETVSQSCQQLARRLADTDGAGEMAAAIERRSTAASHRDPQTAP